MSKIRIFGFADDQQAISTINPTDFSNDVYDGISVYCRRDGKPVAMRRSKSKNPLRWQVIDGLSEFFFLSAKEAEDFCKLRGYRLLKGERHEAQ